MPEGHPAQRRKGPTREHPPRRDRGLDGPPHPHARHRIYGGFLTHTDHHIGRLIDAIEDLGILDDTLVYVITGDNGASGEGGLRGTFNEMLVFNALAEVETPQWWRSAA